ncbi:MAG: hypothetical protein EZS28_036568, partial [Streblomastix strix]
GDSAHLNGDPRGNSDTMRAEGGTQRFTFSKSSCGTVSGSGSSYASHSGGGAGSTGGSVTFNIPPNTSYTATLTHTYTITLDNTFLEKTTEEKKDRIWFVEDPSEQKENSIYLGSRIYAKFNNDLNEYVKNITESSTIKVDIVEDEEGDVLKLHVKINNDAQNFLVIDPLKGITIDPSLFETFAKTVMTEMVEELINKIIKAQELVTKNDISWKIATEYNRNRQK